MIKCTYEKGEDAVMIKIAIVDDEDIICSRMERMIMNILNAAGREYVIDIYNTGERIKDVLDRGDLYHIIFLDIELDGISGIDVAYFIRETKKYETIQIVFVTGKEGYDRQLFDYFPLGFIEKPVMSDKLSVILEKYFRIFNSVNEIFTYKFRKELYCVNTREILYFKSNEKNLIIKKIDREESFVASIKDIYEQLKGQGFFMPNRSYLVNYRLIRSFRASEIMMINGDIITISRNSTDEVANIRLMIENGGYK